MSTADILKMSTAERLVAMGQLWDAFFHEEVEPASPTWRRAVLAKRKEMMNSPRRSSSPSSRSANNPAAARSGGHFPGGRRRRLEGRA